MSKLRLFVAVIAALLFAMLTLTPPTGDPARAAAQTRHTAGVSTPAPTPTPEPAEDADAPACAAPCWFDQEVGLWYCPCEGGYVEDEHTDPPPPETWPPARARARA